MSIYRALPSGEQSPPPHPHPENITSKGYIKYGYTSLFIKKVVPPSPTHTTPDFDQSTTLKVKEKPLLLLNGKSLLIIS